MKFSIITVCYNSIETIERTIQSVLVQEYADKEYIIIDGNSTDGTKEIINKYKDCLSYWCSEVDNGLYDAMNKGILHTTGDIIAFLNSDDWYEKEVLSRVNQYFEEKDVDVLSGNINHIINGRRIQNVRSNVSPEDIRLKMIYPHQALFAKKEVFNQIGEFDLMYKIASDYDWILRAYIWGAKIYMVNDVFTNCREGGISATNVFQCFLEQKRIALAYVNEYDKELGIEEIEEYYSTLLDYGTIVESYYAMLNRDMKCLQRLFYDDKKYYIWGTGVWGERCFNLFEKLRLDIIGFIDTYRAGESLHGHPIISPDAIESEGVICIATCKYEEEIIEKIKLLGIGEEQYFCFSEVLMMA